ncbi:uncharacterized protein LOC111307255 [Durio zibethinus]|uniref:Uncharacterized protein LOC111307255 n=1 Tax=Durio zibethinus TaxID=66656 RepID=A0A6P6A7V9_DURZI|nr:uncharacterized protein LOC111307255 [Durio zibethinus]
MENLTEMGLRGRDYKSSNIVKEKHVAVQREDVLPRPLSACSQAESIRSKIKRMDPICTARKKVVPVSPQLSTEEDVDFDKQFVKESFSSADDDSMWLSSGCVSPLSFFEEHELSSPFDHVADEWLVSCFSSAVDDSMWLSSGCVSPSSFFKEHELSSPFDLMADEWLVSWLSRIADSYISLSKGASFSDYCKSKPEEHNSFPLAIAVSGKILQNGLEGEGGSTWQLHSLGNYAPNPLAYSAERIESFRGHCSDESTSHGNSLMSLSTDLDTSSQVSDTDKSSFVVSSLNLDEDGSQGISNTELESDYLKPFSPSPSCKNIWGSEAKSNISTTINREDEITESNLSLEQTSEAENIEDFGADEPLFWPFDRKIDWNSEETWKYFSMSPRKDITKVTTPEGTSPISIGSELNTRNRNLPNRCRRNLVLDSGSTASKVLELKQGSKGYNNNNSTGRAKRGNTMVSRLRETTKGSAKMVPLDIDNQILPLKGGEVPTTTSVLTSRNFWEDDFTSNEELPIETVLGLGEFDGHEGIDSEFNEGVFSLDEAL